MEKIRIQKYLSGEGIASRREAEKLMLAGLVRVNGRVVTELGTKVDPKKDKVEVVGSKRRGVGNNISEKKTVILNKPRDVVSSRDSREGKTIFDLFPEFQNLNILGRLDKESEGLLMLSNDGVLARAITGEEHRTEKEYEVSTRETVRPMILRIFEGGVALSDGPTLPTKTKKTSDHSFSIVLREGRKHQVRRMCDKAGLTVTKLKRVRIGPVSLGRLRGGEWRELDAGEVNVLKG